MAPLADDPDFRRQWQDVKLANKRRLARHILSRTGLGVDPTTLFDVQVKRIHEYKRQLLNVLHVVTLYNRLRAGTATNAVPRTVIFAGKAAPAYHQAKLIIKLINAVAETIAADPAARHALRVVFLPNYCVSQAEKIVTAADLSEQISTAGLEASGTGNMKMSLNGALTIGTLDGANVEIMEEVGRENIFIFGLTAAEVVQAKRDGYDPWAYRENNAELRQVLDMIGSGYFSPDDPSRVRAHPALASGRRRPLPAAGRLRRLRGGSGSGGPGVRRFGTLDADVHPEHGPHGQVLQRPVGAGVRAAHLACGPAGRLDHTESTTRTERTTP